MTITEAIDVVDNAMSWFFVADMNGARDDFHGLPDGDPSELEDVRRCGSRMGLITGAIAKNKGTIADLIEAVRILNKHAAGDGEAFVVDLSDGSRCKSTEVIEGLCLLYQLDAHQPAVITEYAKACANGILKFDTEA